jgi:hypothetical protein
VNDSGVAAHWGCAVKLGGDGVVFGAIQNDRRFRFPLRDKML